MTRFVESLHYQNAPDRARGLLTIRRAGHVEAGADYAVQRDALDGHDLLLCVSGRGRVRVDDAWHPMSAGELAWLPGHWPHAHVADAGDPWSVSWLRLHGEAAEPCRIRLMPADGAPLRVGHAAPLLAWFQRLFACLRLRSPDLDLPLNALAAELMAFLETEAHGRPEARLPPALARVLPAMAAAPERPWNAAAMEAASHASAAHLRRLFRRHLGVTPRAWLRRERILLAQDLLTRPGARVGQVAEACGFSDVFHFSRDFRRMTGMSPTTWRGKGS